MKKLFDIGYSKDICVLCNSALYNSDIGTIYCIKCNKYSIYFSSIELKLDEYMVSVRINKTTIYKYNRKHIMMPVDPGLEIACIDCPMYIDNKNVKEVFFKIKELNIFS